MTTNPTDTIDLPTDSISQTVTEYVYPQGYAPTVTQVSDLRFPQWILTEVTVREGVYASGTPWHAVDMMGYATRADGTVKGNRGDIVNPDVARHLYVEHLARTAA